MSAVAVAMFAAGAYSAHLNREGRYGNADERNRAARESLLTASWNIKERNKESQQTQYQVLDTGGNLIQKIAIAGKQAEGTGKVSSGSSGVVVESGSSNAALAAIARKSLEVQTEVLLDTKHRIKSIARDTENQNRSEWRNAKQNEEQQNRIASREKESADKEFTASLLNSGINAYATGSKVKGSKTPEVTKTTDTTKKISTASKNIPSSKPIEFKIPNQKSTKNTLKGTNYDQAYKSWMNTKGKGFKLPWLK